MMEPETSSGFTSSSSSSSISLRTTGDSTFLDPPSYADAIFRPTEPQISGNLTSDYLEITVTDPQRAIDPSTSSHITYLVTTRVRNAPSPFAVRRRFRQFVALADRLAESYRGLFVPTRPDKSVAAVESDEFLERRRDELEKYLRRIVAHPVVGCGGEIRAFLTGEEEGLNVPPGSVGRDWARMFKELKQSVASDWGGMKASAEEEDKGFLERKGMVEKLKLHISSTSEQVFGFRIVFF